MNANVLIAAHEATRRGVALDMPWNFSTVSSTSSCYRCGSLGHSRLPEVGQTEGLSLLGGLLVMHFSYRRLRRQQEHQIRHRTSVV